MSHTIHTSEQLEALLDQAASQAWSQLALTDLRSSAWREQQLEDQGWPANRVFIVDEALAQPAVWPRLPSGLRFLVVGAFKIGNAGARAIADKLVNLNTLDLLGNEIGGAGARAIADKLVNLNTLHLWNNRIGEAGARAIADKLVNLNTLNLGYNRIGDTGARVIAEKLINLTTLNLSGNRIGNASARAIANKLVNLNTLHLKVGRIGDAGARAIADKLVNLTTLDLWGNLIGDAGARAIADKLVNLTTLDLGYNQIGDAGARAIADKLVNLTTLDLWKNQIGDAGARAIADKLVNLTTLGLESNGLRTLPAGLATLPRLQWLNVAKNQIADLPTELSRSSSLRYLFLHENEGLKLSKELLGEPATRFDDQSMPPNAPAILQWLARQITARRRLNEAKMLLVGQGGVGKTSLVRYVVDGLKREPGQPRTDGILIRESNVASTEHPDERIQLNVWDFGGQEIMHATHQFFLTQRSLYLLVLDARKGEQEGNLHYWLGLIHGLGGDSPVIVVTNQCDGGNSVSLNEPRLRLDYPNIRAFVRTSCETGLGIDELRGLIAREINSLPNVREEWPEAYFLIKQQLAERAKASHHVKLAEYKEICAKNDVTSEDEQINVLRFLHDLGVVLYYADDRLARDARLHDRMILDPGWVTDGVYRVLTSQELAESKGVLDIDNLPGIMRQSKSPYRYDAQGRQYILGMMENFELCYEFQERRRQRYLVPERLDEKEPTGLDWKRADALRFQVGYSVLPGGVIPRLITRTATLQSKELPPWRSGVVLSIEGCEAYIRGDRRKNRIFIQVHGEAGGRRRALAVIRHELREINATLPGIEIKELVPLPEEPDITVEYEYLLELERDGDKDFRPQGAKRRYKVRDLLEGVGRPDEWVTRRGRLDPEAVAPIKTPRAVKSDPSCVADLFGNTDVAIITVRADEFQAVLDRLDDSRPIMGGRNLYEFGRLETLAGGARIVVCRCPEQGNLKAMTVTRNLLDDLSPPWIALVGIAGGFPDSEFTLGDVLVASRLHDFSVTAALEGQPPELDVRGGPLHPDVQKLVGFLPAHEKRMLTWADAEAIRAERPRENVPPLLTGECFYGSEPWRAKVHGSLYGQFGGESPRLKPKLVIAPNAGGNTLLKDTQLAERWKEAARSAASVEMELAGVYEAVHEYGSGCRLIGIRGISDIVGYKRNPAWTAYACHSAASFAYALIRSGILQEIATG